MPLPPLEFAPILKPRAWGGYALTGLGKKVPASPAPPTGESWELADLAPPVVDGVSRVAHGAFAGHTISELLRTHGAALLGNAAGRLERFPLLIKYLDAAENLSVQVHPTAAYAAKHPGAHLKTEAWIVVQADAGAGIYRGVKASVTPEQFRAAIMNGTAVDLLVRESVQVGDCIPLESGLCHALGAGVVVAEIQTPSDTTFRVYDWNRGDPARPLHIEEAMECILFGAAQRLEERPITRLHQDLPWSLGLRAASLCQTEFFQIELIESSPSGDAQALELSESPSLAVLMLIRGEAVVETEGLKSWHMQAGTTLLLPAELVPTTVDLAPDSLVMRATLPHPMRKVRDDMRPGERLT